MSAETFKELLFSPLIIQKGELDRFEELTGKAEEYWDKAVAKAKKANDATGFGTTVDNVTGGLRGVRASLAQAGGWGAAPAAAPAAATPTKFDRAKNAIPQVLMVLALIALMGWVLKGSCKNMAAASPSLGSGDSPAAAHSGSAGSGGAH